MSTTPRSTLVLEVIDLARVFSLILSAWVSSEIFLAQVVSLISGTFLPDEPVSELAARMKDSDIPGFCVLDRDEQLVGIVTRRDVEAALVAGPNGVERTTANIMTRSLITCAPNECLREVLPRLTSMEIGQIPVVDPKQPERLLGVIQRKQIFWAYGELASEHRRLPEEAGLGPTLDQQESVQVELEIEAGHTGLCFKKVRDIQVPEQSLIVLVRRAEQAIIPRGDTKVEPGDVLVLLTTRPGEQRLRRGVAQVSRADPEKT